jgi:hypothetical protein
MQEALVDAGSFTILYNNKTWEVQAEHFGPGNTVYLVKFKGGGLFIALTRATSLNAPHFWATVPENYQRQEEAQLIGKLIAEYLK